MSNDSSFNITPPIKERGFPGGSVVKNPPTKAGDMGLIPGLGICPGEGNGNPFQYSCLGEEAPSGLGLGQRGKENRTKGTAVARQDEGMWKEGSFGRYRVSVGK